MDRWGKKRSVMQRYDLTAYMYDMRYSQEQTAKFKVALQSLNLQKDSAVLDVGCGTGLLFGYVVDKAETIVGLDISKKILLHAKNRARKFSNVELVWADSDYMPLKENVFSHVFAFTLIQNVPSPTKTLCEIRRVAQRNAIITVTGLKKAFALNYFQQLLRRAGLQIVSLKEKELKCYIALSTVRDS